MCTEKYLDFIFCKKALYKIVFKLLWQIAKNRKEKQKNSLKCHLNDYIPATPVLLEFIKG